MQDVELKIYSQGAGLQVSVKYVNFYLRVSSLPLWVSLQRMSIKFLVWDTKTDKLQVKTVITSEVSRPFPLSTPSFGTFYLNFICSAHLPGAVDKGFNL